MAASYSDMSLNKKTYQQKYAEFGDELYVIYVAIFFCLPIWP